MQTFVMDVNTFSSTALGWALLPAPWWMWRLRAQGPAINLWQRWEMESHFLLLRHAHKLFQMRHTWPILAGFLSISQSFVRQHLSSWFNTEKQYVICEICTFSFSSKSFSLECLCCRQQVWQTYNAQQSGIDLFGSACFPHIQLQVHGRFEYIQK